MNKQQESWNEARAAEAAREMESAGVEQLLRWAGDHFLPGLGFASSFGAEDVVLIDWIARLKLPIRIFTLDTGRLPEETYEVIDAVRKRYGVAVESFFPERSAVEKLEREKGMYSFRESVENRKECCRIRKVEPLGRALKGLAAWITGQRREQAVTRTRLAKVEWDAAHGGKVKLNPLADWSTDQVWEHIRKFKVPVNKLHAAGYPSIGCAHCTRAVRPGEDIRSGRWWWERPEHKECGLHLPAPPKRSGGVGPPPRK